jgi:hypothetical protein
VARGWASAVRARSRGSISATRGRSSSRRCSIARSPAASRRDSELVRGGAGGGRSVSQGSGTLPRARARAEAQRQRVCETARSPHRAGTPLASEGVAGGRQPRRLLARARRIVTTCGRTPESSSRRDSARFGRGAGAAVGGSARARRIVTTCGRTPMRRHWRSQQLRPRRGTAGGAGRGRARGERASAQGGRGSSNPRAALFGMANPHAGRLNELRSSGGVRSEFEAARNESAVTTGIEEAGDPRGRLLL